MPGGSPETLRWLAYTIATSMACDAKEGVTQSCLHITEFGQSKRAGRCSSSAHLFWLKLNQAVTVLNHAGSSCTQFLLHISHLNLAAHADICDLFCASTGCPLAPRTDSKRWPRKYQLTCLPHLHGWVCTYTVRSREQVQQPGLHCSCLKAWQLRLDLAGYSLADSTCQRRRIVSSQLPHEAQLPVQQALLCLAYRVAAKSHVSHVYVQHAAVQRAPDLRR